VIYTPAKANSKVTRFKQVSTGTARAILDYSLTYRGVSITLWLYYRYASVPKIWLEIISKLDLASGRNLFLEAWMLSEPVLS